MVLLKKFNYFKYVWMNFFTSLQLSQWAKIYSVRWCLVYSKWGRFYGAHFRASQHPSKLLPLNVTHIGWFNGNSNGIHRWIECTLHIKNKKNKNLKKHVWSIKKVIKLLCSIQQWIHSDWCQIIRYVWHLMTLVI